MTPIFLPQLLKVLFNSLKKCIFFISMWFFEVLLRLTSQNVRCQFPVLCSTKYLTLSDNIINARIEIYPPPSLC